MTNQPVPNTPIHEDASGCSNSDAIRLTVTRPVLYSAAWRCVPNPPLVSYRFGGWVRIRGQSVGGSAGIRVRWNSHPDCAFGSETTLSDLMWHLGAADDRWTHLDGTIVPPLDTRSAQVEFSVQVTDTSGTGSLAADFDMLYLTPSPGGWN